MNLTREQLQEIGWVRQPDGSYSKSSAPSNSPIVKPEISEPSPKRIRQSSKPLLNKLETEFYEYLKQRYPENQIYPQAVTLRLGNGVKFTPDFMVWTGPALNNGTFYEVKGRQQIQDDASVKIKMAATLYPGFQFVLVWKLNGKWNSQTVLP